MTGVINDDDMSRAREMIAAAAHDMKSPLVLIRGLAETLSDPAYDSAELRKELLYKIDFSSKNALSVIEDVLTVSKLKNDQLELALEPISPQSILYDVAHELTPIARSYDQKIEIKRYAGPTMYAHRLSTYRIMYNLLTNAIKYSEPGPTTVLSSRKKDDRIHMNVADHGLGITDAELKQIFKKFGTAKQPVSKHSGSSGLGLHIVRNLTQAMSGDFGVKSRRNGSDFFVSFPVTPQLSLFS